MTGKQRIQAALAHRQPDRIPVDFGSTGVTGIHVLAASRLRDYFGLAPRPLKVIEPYQMLGEVDDELGDLLGIDVEGMGGPRNLFGFPNKDWKEWRTPWGQEVLVPGKFNTTQGPDGSLLIYPAGDTLAPPSGKMSPSGYFFNAVIRQPPLVESQLDPEDNLQEFSLISEEDLNHWRRETERLKNSEKGIIASFGGTGLGDIALVPALHLKHPMGIRDVAEWYISTLTRRDHVRKIFEKQTEIALKNLQEIHSAVGLSLIHI